MTATLLSLHLMEYRPAAAARAIAAWRRSEGDLQATPGLACARPCATSNLFLPTLRRLGVLCAWEGAEAADAFIAGSPVLRALTGEAEDVSHLRLQPVRAVGRWHGVPFATDAAPPLRDGDEPLLAFVHGRLRPRHAPTFYRANVRVARFARRRPGFLGALGLHESPLRFASFSWWGSLAAAREYAYGPGDHRPVVRPYKEVPWASDWCSLRLRPLDEVRLLDGGAGVHAHHA